MGTYPKGPYKKAKNHKVPSLPGKERYVSKKTGKSVYDGTTNNLAKRTAKQKADKKPYTKGNYELQFKVADHRSTDKTRKTDEKKVINRKQGKFNQKPGGGGRIPNNPGRRQRNQRK